MGDVSLILVLIGTTSFIAYGGGDVPPGYVIYNGTIIYDTDDDTLLLMVWDDTVDNGDGTFGNIRAMNSIELADHERTKKIKELTNEAVKRARLVYGDNGFDELHFKILIDLDNTYNRPGSTANRITDVVAIGTVWTDTIDILNLMTDSVFIKDYSVVNEPLWP